MKKLTAIGEALVDFIPNQRGCDLKTVEAFSRRCGGAPANVAAVCGKLGVSSAMIGCVGQDPFGDYICEVLRAASVDVRYMMRTDEANTTLAFVSLREDGNREFMFYRRPGADMFLREEALSNKIFEETGILHFCSVGLVESPSKYAHKRAIALTRKNGGIVSFDPNIRLPLWASPEMCRRTVWKFLPQVDLLKVSDEELEFITGKAEIDEALSVLFAGEVKMVLFSKGKGGAALYTKNGNISVCAPEVEVKDTTGAGDAMIGSFLACLIRKEISLTQMQTLPAETFLPDLQFAVYYASLSVTNPGAIASYADRIEIEKFIESFNNK